MSAATQEIDIPRLIQDGRILPQFQPLVSVRRRAILGYEGLSRGLQPENGGVIPADRLFREASAAGLTHELDQACRQRILGHFSFLHRGAAGSVLSLNMDAASAIARWAGTSELDAQVAQAGLTAKDIVIEIVESAVEDTAELQRFVQAHRESGYLIALDDVGSGHSNLNRIPLIRPDIIKIDRYLVEGIHQDFFKQEVLKSLVSMARHLGTVIIAEGVETADEGSLLFGMGVDLFQGYFFARPSGAREQDSAAVQARIGEISAQAKSQQMQKVTLKRISMCRRRQLLSLVQASLSLEKPPDFERVLTGTALPLQTVECLYVLNLAGHQVTSMVFNSALAPLRRSSMFHPLPKGADHSMRDYYYFLADETPAQVFYVTKPYISMTTGIPCVTLSARFKAADGQDYILCLDVNEPLASIPASAEES
jgi:EAL domain-containing protein (putative c-di-GMP-specific phosphodiesterase class I)